MNKLHKMNTLNNLIINIKMYLKMLITFKIKFKFNLMKYKMENSKTKLIKIKKSTKKLVIKNMIQINEIIIIKAHSQTQNQMKMQA